ncbi:putative U3 small nucleolar RNA-associated protein 25 [Coleophoma crateriformis]|uniref:U3 small nucleolar RNA-associated protein 25 n=1 Tax=Coleophoma crateriformis TaxID=565419 RepID=A0A3D8SYB0_9HELO|nr:putative U3 small nucleolar RNA-associated protein 25 [Coleophoma crateriformis]
MAFHGSRGGSRGRGSISGAPRGRGGMRGRGRGGFRGRGKPIFDSARLAQKKEELEDDNSEGSSSEDEEAEEEAESADDSSDSDEELPPVKSYAALMQSLAADSAPQSKRRKLDHKPEPESLESLDERPVDGNDDADYVEEAEAGPESDIDDLLEDEDDEEDSSDPFEVHFANPNENILSQRLESIQQNQWTTTKAMVLKSGKATVAVPGKDTSKALNTLPTVSSPGALKLKQKLASIITKQRPSFDEIEAAVAPLFFGYQDVLYCERDTKNSEKLRRLVCLHAVNHVFKTRDKVIKNNARLAKEENNDELEFRDQGFTRPKVLMILPTRESCVRMVNMINSICEPDQQENRKRFDDSYTDKEERFSSEKTEDFRELFGGNDDDMFRLGLKFTRKTVKYFSQFYNSDIIFASPLGLRMAIGTAEDKKPDYDFLSSIEMVIVDQADALLMQNWEHVEFIFDHLNLQPKEAHGADFSRIRNWYLDNNAQYFRQTIALAAFNTPELNTQFFNRSKNWSGKVKINASYPGAIQELGLKVKQTFSRLESPSFATDPDARFTYFTTAIIPALTRHSKDSTGTVIFIPSYLDFVRVRNYFSTSPATSKLSFGSISDYTDVKDVSRARSHFLTGRHSVLLYTERAHHFWRYRIKGVRKVIMYGLPDNPIFYKEIVGGYLSRSVQEGQLEPGQGSVRVIFSKWDVMKLERVVGTERVGKMIREKGDTFDFL